MGHVTLENINFGADVGGKRIVTASFTVEAKGRMPLDTELKIDVSFYAAPDEPDVIAMARVELAHLIRSAAERIEVAQQRS